MMHATISDVKNRLSAYLRAVRRGETVVIMDRTEPVARLTPFEPATADAYLAGLVRRGIVSRDGDASPLGALGAPVPGAASVLAGLLEERAEDDG